MSEEVFAFRTIQKAASGKYQEKGSKFLATAFPMSHLGHLESMLSRQKSEHPKARHFCYAYRVLDGGEITEYASDAGEPSGSAGQPILHAILSKELVNVGVVVVRYFGGTKLGIPGLIRAYRTATVYALEDAKVYTHVRTLSYRVEAPLALQPLLLEHCKRLGIETGDLRYDSGFSMQIHVPLEDGEGVLLRLLRGVAGVNYGDMETLLRMTHVRLVKLS